MKAKKLLLAALAVGILVPASAGSVFAATSTGETPVSYDNRNYIPDPDNPNAPAWAVTIPSAVNFTDDNKIIDTTVELISVNGGDLPTTDVTVTVASRNDYKLKKSLGASGDLSYKLIYDGKIMSKTITEVAKLKASEAIKAGTANLGTDKAPERGQYTDTLTYTVSTK